MARIRSVHPGLFTDEAFVAMSSDAQVLLIGLWTEADDQGVFEWKPVTIRMRLRPTKDGDVVLLLSEMEAVNCVRRFEVDGRQYGAIRNFRKFQRPKSPNAVHPCPPDIRNYVGSSRGISEIDDDDADAFPQKGETRPQREDGGKGKGRKKAAQQSSSPPRETEPPAAASAAPGPSPRKAEIDALEERLRTAAGLGNDPSPALFDLSPMLTLIGKGYDLETDILPVLKSVAARGKRGSSWRYYVKAIEEAKAGNDAIRRVPSGPAAPARQAIDWDMAVRDYERLGGEFLEGNGPGQWGYRHDLPPDIAARFDAVDDELAAARKARYDALQKMG